MKRVASLAVYVVAILTMRFGMAQDAAVVSVYTPQAMSQPVIPPTGFVPSTSSVAKFAAKRTGEAKMPAEAFNGFSGQRSAPDFGAPGSAGGGFHHFSLPMDRYTNWYRPKASSLTLFQRCAPEPFRPRGFGNLFARPCDGYRMDYEPYVLSDGMSHYGPSYIARMPDQRCREHCDSDECENCD